jgi:hypothetical protein
MRTITLALLMLCSSAWADVVFVATSPSARITISLHNTKCSTDVERWLVTLQTSEGTTKEGCWNYNPNDDSVEITWSNGNESRAPRSIFLPSTPAPPKENKGPST